MEFTFSAITLFCTGFVDSALRSVSTGIGSGISVFFAYSLRSGCTYSFSFAAVVLVVLVLSVTALVLDERHIDDLVSLSAARSLVTGEAVEYDAQIRERIERIEESPDAEVEVPFITTAPKVLFMGDIRDNMDTYINYRFAQWWSKDAITGYHASL